MRVIKQDGRMLEPEVVAGKPTVTFPHLEVGDYIETEHITTKPSDGQQGNSYTGPHWFFREANVAYARSEFVVIAPKARPLVIETRGNVPAPKMTSKAKSCVRRWRVDFSPAAPVEPLSAPVVGVSAERAHRLGNQSRGATARPDGHRRRHDADRSAHRAHRAAHRRAAAGLVRARERARRLYRWVLDNVEDGQETDGRRVVVGKHGNRWRGFMTLCRALDIRVAYAVAQNRLAMPPIGPLSRAMLFTEPLLVLEAEKGQIWLTVGSKYAPFGYVPAEVRGMPAYLLAGSAPKSADHAGRRHARQRRLRGRRGAQAGRLGAHRPGATFSGKVRDGAAHRARRSSRGPASRRDRITACSAVTCAVRGCSTSRSSSSTISIRRYRFAWEPRWRTLPNRRREIW